MCSLIFLLQFFFKGCTSKKRSDDRHNKYARNVSRLGGVAIIISFLISLFWNENLVITQQITGIVAATILILIFGLIDDYFELDWRIQLFLQVCAAVIVFIGGAKIEYITNPMGGLIYLDTGLLPSLFLGIFWIVLLMNSMNWIDGIDGLSGGVALIAVLAIFFLSIKPEVNQPPVGIITMILAGSFLGFLIFNFHPAKIIAGTSGAMFMGFILAALSIFAGTKIATTLLVLSIAVIDVLSVMIQRIRSGESVFVSDRRHLHHKLLELGWSHRKINIFFYATTALVAFVALNTREIGKVATIVLVILIMFLIMIVINKKINEKSFRL
ncbi:MAG: undecaprenyl/decaprenyl-phosphate alpha-N-acetylglucosaminyl 1-phosphate transferase [Candidatus Moranbacteria bacterium]|nr:undecaprenyl/decaprenyl-phosphate alpha-N-acetylglucosaminyl 1-phosphate transferase [Candidatus Moranbacteria bacterium]